MKISTGENGGMTHILFDDLTACTRQTAKEIGVLSRDLEEVDCPECIERYGESAEFFFGE